MALSSDKKPAQVETTGHVWDGDLREYNNPLPRWWLWTFYATIVFTIVYWIMYPAWPVFKTFTPGLSTLTIEQDGKMVEVPWNSRYLFIQEMQTSPSAVRQREFVEKVSNASFEQIVADPSMLAFAPSYPSLADNEWLWGGSFATISNDLHKGLKGNMPAFPTIQGAALTDLSNHVLSLSGIEVDAASASRGKASFAMCAACHGADGKGNPMLGAPNLTDMAWSNIDVVGASTVDAKRTMIEGVVSKGIQREMPGFANRLTPVEIKMLTVYVHELSGGQ
ncbi:MAG: cytochrome-c oxidase, cbb3-type subunit III [Gammaproteobacteria bacterium 28-57-27]|nr:MAG: cytochrome-c oxidase, cbb3-type subunit III [Gammaproteobacteria bacterium 28-57-27]